MSDSVICTNLISDHFMVDRPAEADSDVNENFLPSKNSEVLATMHAGASRVRTIE